MASRADHQANIRDFILARELAEVYLLLDNIATTQSKTLPTEIADPAFTDKAKWLNEICAIVWPPVTEAPVVPPAEGAAERAAEGQPEQPARAPAGQALNAAKLLRAKDALNVAAAPATGASIAFTVLMTDEARLPQWLRRAWRHRHTDEHDGDGSSSGGGNGGGGRPPTRISLAAQAYPAYARKAWRYRLLTALLLAILTVWLILTCFLSWNVATGNALLTRVTTLDAEQAKTAAASLESPPSGGAQSPGTPLVSGTVPPATTNPPQNAMPAKATAPSQAPGGSGKAGTPPPAGPSAQQKTNGGDASRIAALHDSAVHNLGSWLQDNRFVRAFLTNRMGGSREQTLTGDQVNVEWATVFIGVLANNILPIFYGLLGSGAAVVRIVSDRIRDSTLMPRHIRLAFTQLALGAVIGACVGLFAPSDGDATSAQSGLLGAVTLSTSALCFVAGFGVEGVFQALESLVRRVFNLDRTKSASN